MSKKNSSISKNLSPLFRQKKQKILVFSYVFPQLKEISRQMRLHGRMHDKVILFRDWKLAFEVNVKQVEVSCGMRNDEILGNLFLSIRKVLQAPVSPFPALWICFVFLSNMDVLHNQSVLSVDIIDVIRGVQVYEHLIMYIVVKLFVLRGRNLKFDKPEHLNYCLLSKNSFCNYQHFKFLLKNWSMHVH